MWVWLEWKSGLGWNGNLGLVEMEIWAWLEWKEGKEKASQFPPSTHALTEKFRILFLALQHIAEQR